MDELKECPFCGGKVQFRQSHVADMSNWIEHYPVTNCGLEFSDFNLSGDIIQAWNTRTKPE